ncbi:hypothetical protein PROFUN_06461 [Planoprotostelium fungivorum]|uniref:Fatty acid hydroxylase domain-containing protein n=1 Tax=Planoprotostelium fungivorum TaxID=1890364 RepID=A0A2P6MR38_9EUKA|nr:hypothetical protein PROFUN_06461 [Planoprotostelium fungivorum]
MTWIHDVAVLVWLRHRPKSEVTPEARDGNLRGSSLVTFPSDRTLKSDGNDFISTSSTTKFLSQFITECLASARSYKLIDGGRRKKETNTPLILTQPYPAQRRGNDLFVNIMTDEAQTVTTRRPRATWHLKPWSEQTIWEKFAMLDVGSPEELEKRAEPRDYPPPVQNNYVSWIFLACAISPPFLLQGLWYHLYPESHWPTWVTYIVYQLWIQAYIIFVIKHVRGWMSHFGTLDEANRPRDVPPDNRVKRLIISVFIYIYARGIGCMLLSRHDPSIGPALGEGITYAFPLKIVAWHLTLDFWFYLWHRSAHTVPWIWRLHAGHHNTKYPTPIQSILADDVQEIIEIAVVPGLTALCIPMTFHELYISILITLYVEAMGHSGMRADWGHPVLDPVLRPFNLHLVIEDHDLHHRHGKGGKNYGKQSRLWDTLFNTRGERIECLN